MRDAEQHYAGESAALRDLARLESEAAQLRASSAQASQSAARLEEETAQRARDRREFDQVSAQLREEAAIARAATSLDVLAVARRMLAANVPLRDRAARRPGRVNPTRPAQDCDERARDRGVGRETRR
jgi:Tfp pilus assembly protein PilO